MKRKKDQRLHFVGIGGIGMSGIAEVFVNQGYPVTGSDLAESDSTRKLAALGARIAIGHAAANVGDASVVVISSAVRPTNPEVVEARKRQIPVIPRAEMLAELMRGKIGVAVAGTHGKTTTTSMLATILTQAGLDPTLVIGGKVDSLGGNAKLGQGALIVAEADESDGSFLTLPSTYGVITNIDNDHLDHYGTLEKIDSAFVDFVGRQPFYGMTAVCIDDPGVARCVARFSKPYVTYGFSATAQLRATALKAIPFGTEFKIDGLGEFSLEVPGRHNVLNALGAIAIARELEVPLEAIQKGIAAFRGVRRRFDVRWRAPDGRRLIVDDYGHHPTEVTATLAAARESWTGRIITVFQPHRYTRTLHCRDGFLGAFRQSDLTLITDVYAAGEDPIVGVTSDALARDIQAALGATARVVHSGDLEASRVAALAEFRDGDLLLCLGAGSITKLADQLREACEK